MDHLQPYPSGRATLALTLTIGLALWGCDDTPTIPGEIGDLPVSLAPGGNGNGNGSGGGPPGGGGPDGGSTSTDFRDGGDRIHSDGLGTYLGLSAVASNGQFSLDPDETSGRDICVDWPQAGPDADIVSQSDWDELVAISNNAVGLGQTSCFYAKLHTTDHAEDGGLLGMDADAGTTDVDDVQASGGKLVLREYDGPRGSWHWRLIFSDAHSNVNNGDRNNGVCIRKNADGTWTLGSDPSIADGTEDPNACGEVDEYINLIRFDDSSKKPKDHLFIHVATFRMPFRMTVTPEFE